MSATLDNRFSRTTLEPSEGKRPHGSSRKMVQAGTSAIQAKKSLDSIHRLIQCERIEALDDKSNDLFRRCSLLEGLIKLSNSRSVSKMARLDAQRKKKGL